MSSQEVDQLTLAATQSVFRALRRGWIDDLSGELTTAAFLKRELVDSDGLSVSTLSVEHCKTQLRNTYGVAELTVECIRDGPALDVIPDSIPHHANINTSLPPNIEPYLRDVERYAGLLLDCATVVWRRYPVP